MDLMNIFKELHLIEQWGTGVRRIFAEARELGLPEPEIEEIALRLRFTVFLAKQHRIQIDNQRPLSGVESGDQLTAQVEAQVEAQVGAQVEERILRACAKTPLSSGEIAAALGHKTLSGNLRRALPALREAGFLEYTIPDKPSSRLQKYRLTETGKHALEEF
jgi:ATP-dependent DNA helicase RecG